MTDQPTFAGLRVASFESRRAVEMARLIERYGGVPLVSPSLREVELPDHRPLVDFAHRLLTGQVDVLVLMTGVGMRHLLAEVERHVDRARFVSALADTVTVARGPKPIAVLKELGVSPTHRVPEPNTWREVLATIDHHVPVAQQRVAVQEYGQSNVSLIAGLEARGAKVEPLRVYRWELPEDTGPLEANIQRMAAGEIDVALFTSAHQAVNLLRVAARMERAAALRQALARIAVASIGPTTSETLRELDLPVDIEPAHSKMGQLVAAAAHDAAEVLARKRAPRNAPAPVQSTAGAEPRQVASGIPEGPWSDSLFLRACRRQPVERTPIWLMRQAGRYLPEYAAIRRQTTFAGLCKSPQQAAEVMLATVARLGVDAAILFSDLLLILEPMGLALEYSGEGPQIHNPVREAADVDRVRELESVDPLGFVVEAVRLTRAGLPGEIPLIGFAGAPFTLASYAIEGGTSRNWTHTKELMYREPNAWHALAARLARAVVRYLNAQIAAGAQAVQLFDSWVGCLSAADYREFVLPHSQAAIAEITPGVPVIHFATGNPSLLPHLAEAGGDVIGVDWRIELDDAWQAIGHRRGIQGNLDPCALLGDRQTIRGHVERILAQAGGRPGHVFNLGHGVLPQTPVENVLALIEMVRELTAH